MFHNLKAFKAAREQIDEIAIMHIKGDVKKIPWVGKNLGDECRQCGLDGQPAASLDALYEVAALARVQFEEIMTAACPESGVKLMFAPLKGRDRAGAKARDEYADKTAPCYSWLFDITRGAALCQTEEAIVQLYASLETDDRVDIVRTKNRFAPPLFNGYQDILMNVAVKVENVSHMCELQIHLMPIKESEALHQSHTVYEYFRSFFLGNSDAVAQRLEMLCKLPVDDANDVDELVDHVLGSDADANLLDGLCALLESIQEFAGVVKVREAILAEKERECGAESVEAGVALYNLGLAYDDLNDGAKTRATLERALPIYEREHGKDSTKMAGLLNNLGNAYGDLGDYAKQRDMLERALPINERTYGRDHPEVAPTLMNLGNAYGALGDHAKKRDMLERALPINERTYGRDHPEVAPTLMNLGNAYGALGDHAKKRDMLERALAIFERAYGRDHANVAITLTNLGQAYYALHDYAKARDMQERALAIKERAYGRDHAQVALTLTNLGLVYGDLGDHAKKRDVLERALAIDERTYGRDHAQVAFPLANLGMLCRDLGDQAKAREYFGRAHAICERAYGPEHQMTRRIRADLDGVQADLKFPLHAAAKNGDLDAMTRLLDEGAETDRANDTGATALLIACMCGQVDAARLLLDHGADVDLEIDANGITPLLVACQLGQIDAVRLLLARGASADKAMKGDLTPLLFTCQQGHVDLARLLLEGGAEVDQSLMLDTTALSYACAEGHIEVVQLLLEHGADANHKSRYRTTPLCDACAGGHVAVVKLLLERGAEIQGDDGESPEGSGGDKFHEGDVVDVRYQGGEKYCPAKISRDRGDGTYDVDFGVDLMENETGVDTRLIRKLLRSPLAIARREGHAEIVEVLDSEKHSRQS